jgi:pantothenate kinase-related protein Tda10
MIDYFDKLDEPFKIARNKHAKNEPCILGITGPPGIGKTTLSNAFISKLSEIGIHAYSVAIDDFYFPLEKRLEKGIKWRALPGSHDLECLLKMLKDIKNKNIIRTIPRYSLVHDCPRESENVNGVISCLIFDGWFLQSELPGYCEIAEYLDYLIYLDAKIEYVKKWRYQREELNRSKHQGGYSDAQMNEFWNQALEPGIKNWVEAQKSKSDLILHFDGNRDLLR